jgi:glycosyltransferase involved in cell wall biosynthesis
MLQKDPLYSIIIPAYNAENFVIATLDSVAVQTFNNYEVIVIDDGSTDSTAAKVSAWAAAHPEIDLRLAMQPNKGIGGARNSGLRQARGKYLAFLDADDYWLPQKLEYIARFLEQSPEVDLVCHDEWVETANQEKQRSSYGPHKAYEDLLFKKNCISTSSTVVKRSIVSGNGFSEDLRFNGTEDYEFWLRLARANCRIEYLHELLTVYRIHDQNISAKIEEHCQNTLNVLQAHFSVWEPKTPYYRRLLRKRQGAVYRSSGSLLRKRGDHRLARRYLLKSLAANPLDWKAWILFSLNLGRI